MADSETAQGLSVEFAAAHDATDAGDWAEYVNARSGPFVKRDELAVRTWYQASEDCNEYGEETVRIKGVYATSVGEDTPILTRLAQWRIVPKRAVDLAVDFKDASESSRSSVNNCTGGLRSQDSKRLENVDDYGLSVLTRKERRRLLVRVRVDIPEKRHRQLRRSDKTEAACDNVIGQIRDITRETISRAVAVHLIIGTETKIDGLSFRSSAGGELFRARSHIEIEKLFSRIERLKEFYTKK